MVNSTDEFRYRRGTRSRGPHTARADVPRNLHLSYAPHAMGLPMTDLAPIPVVDVREGGPVRHAVDGTARARALRDDCVTWLSPSARMLLPTLDSFTRRWLQRSRSPYLADADTIAGSLGFVCISFLNGSYQWACTAAPPAAD